MENIQDLTQRLRRGDTSVMNDIIEYHIPIARSRAKYIANRVPRVRDDIIGVALLAVVKAVNWAAEGRLYNDNITAYIMATVSSQITYYLSRLPVIKVPRWCYQKEKENNRIPKVYSYHMPIKDNGEHIVRIQDIDTGCIDRSTSVLGVVDELNLSVEQTTILEHKQEGRTEREIGTIIGKSQQWVNLTIKEIRIKYRRIHER